METAVHTDRWAGAMRSPGLTLAVVLAALVVAGLVGSRVSRGAWEVLRADMPAMSAEHVDVAAGEGVMIGLFGGFRAITADLLWVRANALWEDQDLPATQTLIRLVTTVDSRPLIFWINGARMIGYDMPVWRLEALGREGGIVPAVVERRIFAEQAEAALRLLERARAYHPEEPLLVIEQANLRHRKLGDLAGAAELYRKAAELPGAPYYAARIHAEMLKQLGRDREAYAWLVDVHRELPADDPMAMPEIVLGRIRELEERLGVPAAERYRPENAAGGARTAR